MRSPVFLAGFRVQDLEFRVQDVAFRNYRV